MPGVETVEVIAAVTDTLHDGTNMIVLTKGKATPVASASVPFLIAKSAIEDPAGSTGAANRSSLDKLTLAELIVIAIDEGIILHPEEMRLGLVEAIADKRAADDGTLDGLLGQVVDENGNPVDLPVGDPSDPPQGLDLTETERAALPPLDQGGQFDHDGDGVPGGSLPHDPPALTGKNKAELLAIAAAEHVEADESMTNKQIVDAIEAARASSAEDDDDAPPTE